MAFPAALHVGGAGPDAGHLRVPRGLPSSSSTSTSSDCAIALTWSFESLSTPSLSAIRCTFLCSCPWRTSRPPRPRAPCPRAGNALSRHPGRSSLSRASGTCASAASPRIRSVAILDPGTMAFLIPGGPAVHAPAPTKSMQSIGVHYFYLA